MRIHTLQHVPFEDLAEIGIWADIKGHSVTKTAFFLDTNLPPNDAFDWLVVMGGPMNIYEDAIYPWLEGEKRFIIDAINAGKVIIGVCLGAQLIADVLGARVYRNAEKEIGWHNVSLTPETLDSPAFEGIPADFIAFHWHGDTFPLPPGCTRIAYSEGCANQAFVFKERVIGLQFHLESTTESVARLIENCGDELVEGRYIQSANEILAQQQNIQSINSLLMRLLDNLERNFGGIRRRQ